MIDVGQRGEDQHCPGTWAADGYSSDQFDELRMRISDERETANDERVRAMMNESEVDNDLRNAQVRTRYGDDECEEEPGRPLRRLRRCRH